MDKHCPYASYAQKTTVLVFKNLTKGCIQLHFACNYKLVLPVQRAHLTNVVDIIRAVKKSTRVQDISPC